MKPLSLEGSQLRTTGGFSVDAVKSSTDALPGIWLLLLIADTIECADYASDPSSGVTDAVTVAGWYLASSSLASFRASRPPVSHADYAARTLPLLLPCPPLHSIPDNDITTTTAKRQHPIYLQGAWWNRQLAPECCEQPATDASTSAVLGVSIHQQRRLATTSDDD